MRDRQRGFTLLTLAVTVAVAALITAGAGITTAQVLNGTERNENHSKVIRQAQNLGRLFSRDAMMSESITPGDDPGTLDEEFITFFWKEWENGGTFTVRYLWVDDVDALRQIKRNYVTRDINGEVTGNITATIAASIFSANLTQVENRWTLDLETRAGRKSLSMAYKVTKRLGS